MTHTRVDFSIGSRPMARGPISTLTPDEQERVRMALRELVKQAGSQNSLAQQIRRNQPGANLSQQTIGRYVEGGRPGFGAAQVVAREMKMDVMDLLGRGRAPEERPLAKQKPGWLKAYLAVRATGRFTDDELDAVGDTQGRSVPTLITTDWIKMQVATMREGQAAAEAETAAAEREAQEARRNRKS